MQLRRLPTLDMAKAASPGTSHQSTPRPCQPIYLGESNARRMLKRAQLSKTSPADDPIFALHEEAAAHDALLAAAAPFDSPPPPSHSPCSSTTASPPPSSSKTKKGGAGYSVQCYATHTEDEQRRKDAEAAEKEALVLFRSLNSCRRAEGVHPLKLVPLLCGAAQEHADVLFADEEATIPSFTTTVSSPGAVGGGLYIPNVTVHTSRSGRRRATLVSPPRIGALACGEMWYGGKYRAHMYAVRSLHSEDEEDEKGSGMVGSSGYVCGEDCPCHLRIVFETMVDEGWRVVGIGLGRGKGGGVAGGGRWVVELGE